jgi:predicted dehydrogenase
MFAGEARRDDGMDVIAIMTPNDSHFPLSISAIDHGLDVICDKPLAMRLEEALDLVARVRAAGIVFCQTFNYSGFPMVRQAMAMVRDGDLGAIRLIEVEYIQGHNAVLTPGETGEAPANWHFAPDKVGDSLILGDIGSHAHHMARYVSGLDLTRLTADVGAVVPGRTSDDTAGVLFRAANDARGILWMTQAAAGGVHGLQFRVFGEKGGLEWVQETPNQLLYRRPGQPAVTFERSGPGLKPEAKRAGRVGIGHPEGYQEAFGVLYADAAEAIVARRLGEKPDPLALDFPTVVDGAHTMKFIVSALESARTGGWVDCSLTLPG